jgi:hypothetical protein
LFLAARFWVMVQAAPLKVQLSGGPGCPVTPIVTFIGLLSAG